MPFGQDGSVSTAAFEQRYESELANELGNLASRTMAMIVRYRDGVLPSGGVDPELRRDFAGLAERVSAQLDGAELTLALEEIWQRVRRLNRYVEEQAPWQLAKDEARAGDLDRVLRTLAEGLRSVTVLLWPYLPASAERLLDALGAPDLRCRAPNWAPARSSASARSRRCSRRTARRARARPRDRLAHAPGPVRAAGQRAGGGGERGGRDAHADGGHRRRVLPRGAGGARRRSRRCSRRSAATRTRRRASTTRTWPSCARWPNTSAAWRSARRGLTSTARARRAPTRSARSRRRSRWRARRDKPLVIHSRAADSQTLAQLAAEAEGVSVVMHCFSMPDRLDECLERGYAISFAGNVTYKSAADLGEAARRVPDERLLVETDAPYLTPQAVRKERNQPAFVAHTLAFLAELRGVSARELGATVERNGGARVRLVSGAVSEAPVQPSLRRMRRFGVRPSRELGQNFLVDSNILGVIERAARAARATTSCWRSAAGWACSQSTWPSAWPTCTWWRSTSACARRCATRRTRTRT